MSSSIPQQVVQGDVDVGLTDIWQCLPTGHGWPNPCKRCKDKGYGCSEPRRAGEAAGSIRAKESGAATPQKHSAPELQDVTLYDTYTLPPILIH